MKSIYFYYSKYFPRFVTYDLQVFRTGGPVPEGTKLKKYVHPQLLEILRGVNGSAVIKYSFFNFFGIPIFESYKRIQ